MGKVKLLTQERCPKCDQLKKFLEIGMRNRYKDDIVELKREVERQEFTLLVAKYHLTQTPVLIYEDQVLSDIAPTKVSTFLKEVLGK